MQHIRMVEWRRYSGFTFVENTISNSPNAKKPSFWEVIVSFVSLAYSRLAVSKTLLLRLLACLNFILDSENLFCWCKLKK